ncbi:MAG: hypothetical protein IT323_02535 [Anaerolineae bacterium]|nr:hypothetical protein [Anaerolineae bacterium]
MNRLLGIILIVVGVVLGLVAAAWLFTNPDLVTPARILGLGIALLVLVAPFVGGGVYVLAQGMGDAKKAAEASQQRKLLNVVQSRGQIKLDDAALELQVPKDRLRDMVHSLVGLGVFSGYINWDEGTLYSKDASALRELRTCPNCGGEITLSGKGVARCRFCGTEFFLS